ncbi:uncharacterized protein PHALS_06567 [Plasmopara halstedii]|uniref:Uncharacterized protein n=1 Tax=Plasmopara halstedii TaxID=4781 RepID=A0A0P1B4C3_PLAHL|nr:uncharacterized protein PHALS_06567 [Plasmopara halstedii]CEG48762.1 hypothetical protein PHALS_06567 [Plasmopara halstedii]|eukprot:XP_024585131.1 hypothetical protein PHALS_06567 [Plasmopara halstedii]
MHQIERLEVTPPSSRPTRFLSFPSNIDRPPPCHMTKNSLAISKKKALSALNAEPRTPSSSQLLP